MLRGDLFAQRGGDSAAAPASATSTTASTTTFDRIETAVEAVLGEPPVRKAESIGKPRYSFLIGLGIFEVFHTILFVMSFFADTTGTPKFVYAAGSAVRRGDVLEMSSPFRGYATALAVDGPMLSSSASPVTPRPPYFDWFVSNGANSATPYELAGVNSTSMTLLPSLPPSLPPSDVLPCDPFGGGLRCIYTENTTMPFFAIRQAVDADGSPLMAVQP